MNKEELKDELEDEKISSSFYQLKYKHLILILVAAALVIILIVVLIFHFKSKNEASLSERISQSMEDIIVGQEGKVELVTESTLEKAVKNATLYTASYPYNGVAAVYGTTDEGLKYYVSYKASIKAGINSNNIKIELDEENNIITIRLPEIEFSEPSVDGKFNFIFMDDKYNTGDTYNEAFTAAVNDLNRRIQLGVLDELKEIATESAKMTERALVEPWVNQVDPKKQYTIKVLAYGEEEEE